ncbi:MAG: CHASE3 domain-containing protein [Acidobacteriota bacterium]|nr:CHASE3 domain-containing protein [Acidobacteriota bacterium]
MELREFKRILQQVMIVPILALLILAGVLVRQIIGATNTVAEIEGVDRRIAQAHLVERLIIDEETGIRGYQVTSDARFLDPYRQASSTLPQALSELRQSYAGDGADTSDPVQGLIEEHRAWVSDFAQPLIATVAAGKPTSGEEVNLAGRARMDSIRQRLSRIVDTASRRRAERIQLWQTAVRHTVFALVLLAFAVGLFLALFTRQRFETVSIAFRRALDLQRRHSEELFHSEQHLRTTLASIGDAVITCDRAGAIVTMNPVAQELTGWTEAEARSRPLDQVFQIVNETTRETVESPVTKVKRENRVVGLTNHALLIRRDGSEISIDDSGAPIRTADGELQGIVLVFRDITVERRSRAALLANEKLAVAGRLAATIAHEIHNPLDSVSNLLYLLQGSNSSDETKHFLDLAQSELTRVTQISRAMLSLYRESKAPVAIDLKDTLDDILLLMERRFHDIGVTVSSDLPEHVVVEGFPAELRQVFTNLITNAAEAAGPGGHIHVRVTPLPNGLAAPRSVDAGSPGPGALIEIVDDGPGISAEVRERLFRPFFTTKGEHGTGLGLWVCQGIVRKHGGLLELTDRTDGEVHGTVASVFLACKSSIDTGAL